MERIVIRIRPGKIKGWMEVEISREMSSGVLPESGGENSKACAQNSTDQSCD